MCKILGIEKSFTTTYHSQCKRQAERTNRTALQASSPCVADHSNDWDLYTDILAYAFNTQGHLATKCISSEVLLSRGPQPLPLAPQPIEVASESVSHYLLPQKQWPQFLLDRTGHHLREARDKYRRDFKKRVCVPAQKIKPGLLIFVLKGYYAPKTKEHRSASVAEGPYMEMNVTPGRVLIQDVDCQERILRDRVVKAPNQAAVLGKDNIVQSADDPASQAPIKESP